MRPFVFTRFPNFWMDYSVTNLTKRLGNNLRGSNVDSVFLTRNFRLVGIRSTKMPENFPWGSITNQRAVKWTFTDFFVKLIISSLGNAVILVGSRKRLCFAWLNEHFPCTTARAAPWNSKNRKYIWTTHAPPVVYEKPGEESTPFSPQQYDVSAQ